MNRIFRLLIQKDLKRSFPVLDIEEKYFVAESNKCADPTTLFVMQETGSCMELST